MVFWVVLCRIWCSAVSGNGRTPPPQNPPLAWAWATFSFMACVASSFISLGDVCLLLLLLLPSSSVCFLLCLFPSLPSFFCFCFLVTLSQSIQKTSSIPLHLSSPLIMFANSCFLAENNNNRIDRLLSSLLLFHGNPMMDTIFFFFLTFPMHFSIRFVYSFFGQILINVILSFFLLIYSSLPLPIGLVHDTPPPHPDIIIMYQPY